MNMLNAPERRGRIEAALNQAGGQNAVFIALPQMMPADPGAGEKQEKALDSLISMFGRDKVQIDE